MISVLCSDRHNEAVDGHVEHVSQPAHSTHGQAGSPLLVPVSNAQVGCYLKDAKTQRTSANLILLR